MRLAGSRTAVRRDWPIARKPRALVGLNQRGSGELKSLPVVVAVLGPPDCPGVAFGWLPFFLHTTSFCSVLWEMSENQKCK